MKTAFYLLLLTFGSSFLGYSQDQPLSPNNNTADTSLVQPESSNMNWYIVQDTVKVLIGKVNTLIKKDKKELYVVTTVDMIQATTKWVDTTIVSIKNFKPIYHSSYNQQRDMVLHFNAKVTGYYLDKKTDTKTAINEATSKPYFDSNFYPQLIRFLPLTEGYQNSIAIFDYNPTTSTGVITATIKKTEQAILNLNGQETKVWKVQTTDDISKNQTISTYYIDVTTRKILKHDIAFNGRLMTMEIID
ncbi:hypothetical protein [Olleya sp. UBA1516]|uniref:DUF3108 domain-containing protein n=1 Tax=Olleya sp. UBA1516 TaxID=1947013 RepID=UPI0025E939B7|nr:hypothetical protein [Olleya sp. UBA1516]|tara:strand:+ start:1826 stop:2563 length:738 start_codon:yes stop_codon:yes gene_type:complete